MRFNDLRFFRPALNSRESAVTRDDAAEGWNQSLDLLNRW
jgi:hypothetical protein